MDLWHEIKTDKDAPEKINVIVEIPKGSQNKYEYDKENNIFKLDRVLFSPIHYPGDYGIIPQTLAKDGDPLDALVLVTYPTYPSTLIEARPIGILKMIDSGEEDDKILCVPINDIRLSNLRDINDVQKPILNEIAHFFEVYKHLESKKAEIIGWNNAKIAKEIILQSMKLYKKSKIRRKV
jgi:inorganic pyrophosphatase